jgi:amidase
VGPGKVRQGKVLCLWYGNEQVRYFKGIADGSEYGWANYPTAYGRAMNIARKLADQYDKELATFDAIIMPTVPQPARRHIHPDASPLEWTKHAR